MPSRLRRRVDTVGRRLLGDRGLGDADEARLLGWYLQAVHGDTGGGGGDDYSDAERAHLSRAGTACDAGLPPQCDALLNGTFAPLSNPPFCSDSWCYVDPANCNVNVSASVYLSSATPLYFSYEACGARNRFNPHWLARQPRPPPPASHHSLPFRTKRL